MSDSTDSKEKYQTECFRCNGEGATEDDDGDCHHCNGKGYAQFAYPSRPKLTGKDFPDHIDSDVQINRTGKMR